MLIGHPDRLLAAIGVADAQNLQMIRRPPVRPADAASHQRPGQIVLIAGQHALPAAAAPLAAAGHQTHSDRGRGGTLHR